MAHLIMSYKNYALMHQSTSLKIELHRQWLNGRLIINLFIFSTMPSKWRKTFFVISDSDLYQLRPARTDGMKYLTPASQKLYEKICDKLIELTRRRQISKKRMAMEPQCHRNFDRITAAFLCNENPRLERGFRKTYSYESIRFTLC